MSFSSDLMTLISSPEIVELVGDTNAITFGEATRDNWLRYVIVRQIGGTPEATNDENSVGGSRLDRNLIEIRVRAESYAVAEQIEDLIRRTLENKPGSRAGRQSCFTDPYVETEHKGLISTFEVWHSIDSLPAI